MKNWQLGHIISAGLLIGTIIGILQPAYSTDIGLTQLFMTLFHPGWNQEFLMRWLLVLAFAAAVYMITLQYIYRNTPITVIFTKLSVTFDTAGGAIFTREQLLRANQPNVTAYISKHGASSPTGRVVLESISASAYCSGWQGNDITELRPSGGTVEVLHIFTRPLPFSWYMPLIPTWILHREPEHLFKFIRKNVVQRRDEIHYENEFNVALPMMNFSQGLRYQHFNLSIHVNFGAAPFTDFKVREIQNNGLIDLQYEQLPNNVRVVRVDRMTTGTIRITWTRPQAGRDQSVAQPAARAG
jgi:hypothetical protein